MKRSAVAAVVVVLAGIHGGSAVVRTSTASRLPHGDLDVDQAGDKRYRTGIRIHGHLRANKTNVEPSSFSATIDSGLRKATNSEDSQKLKRICTDIPANWTSNTKGTCNDYLKFQWCTADGDYGEGWSGNGDFSDWAAEGGLGADEACCACGGGNEIDVFLSEQGSEGCNHGADPITDLATCQALSESMGIEFSSSSSWPEGHPRGCHTDGRKSMIWLNANPSGIAHDEFSIMCAKKVQDDDGNEAASLDNPSSTVSKPPSKALQKLRDDVVRTHNYLAQNMKRKVEIGLELHKVDNQGTNRDDIDRNVEAVEKETKSKAFAGLVGDLWKEMRMFSVPFYQERLEEELMILDEKHPKLQADYDAAQAALAEYENNVNA